MNIHQIYVLWITERHTRSRIHIFFLKKSIKREEKEEKKQNKHFHCKKETGEQEEQKEDRNPQLLGIIFTKYAAYST